MVRSAIIIHSLAALGAALLARRVVPSGWAIAVGSSRWSNLGSVWGGGIEGLFAMGSRTARSATRSGLLSSCW